MQLYSARRRGVCEKRIRQAVSEGKNHIMVYITRQVLYWSVVGIEDSIEEWKNYQR